MKVSELIELLSLYDPTDEVVVPVQGKGVSIGPTPSLPLHGARGGFDWDSGKVFMQVPPPYELTVLSQDEYKDLITVKQLVGSLRGRQEIEALSDAFVRKSFLYSRLRELDQSFSRGELGAFDISDLITDVREEKLL